MWRGEIDQKDCQVNAKVRRHTQKRLLRINLIKAEHLIITNVPDIRELKVYQCWGQ